MKIINAIHAQTIGGVDQVFRDYTEILLRQGHEVSLLISANRNCEYKISGVKKIFELNNSAQIFDVLKLLKILIIYRPDLMICHSRRLMNWAKTLRICAKLKIIKTKLIGVNHCTSFEKSLLCDYVISINQEINDLVTAQGFEQNKAFILQNAIHITEKYREKTVKNPPVIAMYGRIEHRKGFDILAKACKILDKNGQDFKLKLGGFATKGDGWDWPLIEQFLEQNNVAHKTQKVGVVVDKKKFFEDVDIFCVPSREEPFGIVILEGFLHSTLVISSDTIGGKLLIRNDENGLLFENESHIDLAVKLTSIIKDSSTYNAKTKKAFLQLEKEFSFDSLERGISEILQKIY